MIFHGETTHPFSPRARYGRAALLALAALALAGMPAHRAFAEVCYAGNHSWPFWGGNLQNTHSSASEHTINAANAPLLTQKWVFATAGDVSATPTIDCGSLYVPDWGGFLYRIDAETGQLIWSHKVSEYTGNSASMSRNSPAIGPDQLVFGDLAGGTVMSVDKGTGKLLWKTTVETAVAAVITNSPVIVGNRVYVGTSSRQEGLAESQPGFTLTFRGSVVALDLRTGKVLWQTYTVPVGYTGAAVWGSNFVVDRGRNSLFVTSGNNYSVPDSVSTCLVHSGATVAGKLACLDLTDYLDSVLALDLDTGKVKWGQRLEGADTWTVSCIFNAPGKIPCPDPAGPDYDFASGPNFIQTEVDGKPMEAIGAGQKSGVYWALNPDTGAVLWGTQVGPGGQTGGIVWGSATDGRRVYSAVNNSERRSYTLQPENTQEANAGSWAALDAGTGAVEWQVPATGQNPLNPSQAAAALGQVTVANGVFYAGSDSGDMVALDAETGKLLWKFPTAGSVISGPSIVDGTLYWRSGYSNFGFGKSNKKLYAFSLPNRNGQPASQRIFGPGSGPRSAR